MSYRPLRSALRGMLAAFTPWAGKTVKQEDAVAAAEKAIRMDDLRAEQIPDISSESREIIGDLFGTVALISDEPFTLEEIDTLLKEQRARTTRSIDPANMKIALERIERWELPESGRTYDNGTPIPYGFVWGSNGERDYMRGVARVALEKTGAAAFEDAMIESIREFADQVLGAAQDCCIDPDAGPDASTSVRFTGKDGCEIGTTLHRLVGAVEKPAR